MSQVNFDPTYTSRVSRELAQVRSEKCQLTPFKAQAIVFEILKNHLMVNKPQDLGFPFSEVYDPDETKSKIFIDLSNNWKSSSPQKRPAVFVYRSDANYDAGPKLTNNNLIGINVAESEEVMLKTVSMQVMLNCIHSPVGAVESFADYIKYPFLYFSKQIKEEYCFRQFKVLTIGAPEANQTDAKDAFSVKITLALEFYDTWMTKGDHLKLKSMQSSVTMHDSNEPLTLQ
jgi:hypothetical protein